jgi:hypothetical protein
MSWVAVAVGGAAVVGSVAGGMIQAGGQKQAAKTQEGMFNTIVGQEQPFMQAGYGATSRLSQLLGLTPGGANNGYLTQQFNPTQEQLNNYPGYQFALKTGGQAIRNADTPGVGSLSGPALKDLMNFNVGTANQYYGQYFNQFQEQQNNIFNRLSSIASLGQNAASNVGNNGAQLGTGIAQAQAAQGASLGGAFSSAGNTAGNGLMLNYLLSGNGNSSSLGGVPGVTGASMFG